MTINNVLYSSQRIKDSVFSAALKLIPVLRSLEQSNKGKHILYVCIMDGAVQFCTDLIKYCPGGEILYLSAKSYGDRQGLKPAEISDVRIETHPCKHVDFSKIHSIVLIDDICDSGNTLEKVARTVYKEAVLQEHGDVCVFTAVMFNRKRPDKVFQPFTCGIEFETNQFLAGYGLDDNGLNRNLPYVYDCTPGEVSYEQVFQTE